MSKMDGPARVAGAGVAAGLAFTGFCMACYATGGRGGWRPLNLIAHTLWRGSPTTGEFRPLPASVGLMVVLAAGIAMISPYALVMWQAEISPAPVVVAGAAIYFNAVWIVGDYVFWPKIDPVAAAVFSPGVAWIGHLIAGAAAGIVLVLRRGSARQMLKRGELAVWSKSLLTSRSATAAKNTSAHE